MQTESGEDVLFSVELESELLTWEKAFQMATFLEVERIQVRVPTSTGKAGGGPYCAGRPLVLSLTGIDGYVACLMEKERRKGRERLDTQYTFITNGNVWLECEVYIHNCLNHTC